MCNRLDFDFVAFDTLLLAAGQFILMKKVVDSIRRFARCAGDNGYKSLSVREQETEFSGMAKPCLKAKNEILKS